MPPYDLWITARCAERDLGIDDWPGVDGVFNALSYRAIRKFYELRRQDPEGAERIGSLTEEVCFELHIDRDRGATWYDRENEVVFLLAVGWHEEDSRNDFYKWVARLERSGELYPEDEDYRELTAWRDQRDWTRIRQELGPRIFTQAESEPNTGFSVDLGPCNVGVEAVVVDEELVGYRLVVWPSERPVALDFAERVVAAVCAERGLRPVLINTPQWGEYLFDIIATDTRT